MHPRGGRCQPFLPKAGYLSGGSLLNMSVHSNVSSTLSFPLLWVYNQKWNCWVTRQLYFQHSEKSPYCFSTVATPFFLAINGDMVGFRHLLASTCSSSSFFLCLTAVILMGPEHLLMINDVEHLLMCLLTTSSRSLDNRYASPLPSSLFLRRTFLSTQRLRFGS